MYREAFLHKWVGDVQVSVVVTSVYDTEIW